VTKARTQDGSKNPFLRYQTEKVTNRVDSIETYLKTLRRSRVRYEFVTDLAKAVAAQLSICQNEPCSFTTILRNKRYKALLLSFLAENAGANSVKSSEIENPRAQAAFVALEVDVVNLRRENERLLAYVSELQGREVRRDSARIGTSARSDEGAAAAIAQSNDYALLCKSLWLVLKHFKELVAVDSDRKCIIDLAAPARRNVIVDVRHAKPFFDWLAMNRDVGL